ncbi:MAG: hypothetical protein ACRD3G_23195 [Vicinamibacterales bacterium]
MSERTSSLDAAVRHAVIDRFVPWLAGFGTSSYDHQTLYSGPIGGAAKSLYYRRGKLGAIAVAPLVFCEAFAPGVRRVLGPKLRFPIADAHYAMGFGYLYRVTGQRGHLQHMEAYLDALERTRCPGFDEYCWGYPFDWVTRNGTIARDTPLITTTPYVYEAFLLGYEITGREDSLRIMASIARHAANDIKAFPVSADAASCSYTPFDGGGVINAAAYRAFLLTSAARMFDEPAYWTAAQRNLAFVLDTQNPDGSWQYAVDGVRDFVDHFHTCFVMKALAKIHALTGHERTLSALERGVEYYLANLLDGDGLPKPFSKAPRLTVYKRELYDCAEAINLGVLLGGLFPRLNATLHTVIAAVLRDWVKPDGSFRARQLMVGWDNVPMHRWAQSQMFRSLSFWLANAADNARNTSDESISTERRRAETILAS